MNKKIINLIAILRYILLHWRYVKHSGRADKCQDSLEKTIVRSFYKRNYNEGN